MKSRDLPVSKLDFNSLEFTFKALEIIFKVFEMRLAKIFVATISELFLTVYISTKSLKNVMVSFS